MNILVVGAGFSGAVVSRELADAGHKITLIDKRPHIGGNSFDYIDEYGIRIHKYGAHIFHTNNRTVFEWLSRFTEWVEYTHKVKAQISTGEYVTFPPNIETINKVGVENISSIFYEPYTRKMWGLDVDKLDSDIIDRVPYRTDMEDRYFPHDTIQVLPKNGYAIMFANILNHNNICVQTGTEFKKSMENEYDFIFNSMPIDEYYDYKYGELPYRSIKFTTYNIPMVKLLPTPTVNFTHDGPDTRITEWKNFPNHGYNSTMTTVTVETPCDYKDNYNERYYPINDSEGVNRELYKKYQQEPNPKTTFIGRCGMYVYIDMHQAVSSSLSTAKKFLESVVVK